MKTPPPNGTAVRILVVDHETPMRESIRQMLNHDGFPTDVACNRHEALARIHQGPVDLVILNMLIPGAEGIGTLIGIRSAAPAVKIIAMAGGHAAGTCDFLPLAKSLGATAVLGNPLDREKLLATVHEVATPELRQMAS
jgi:two-component system response regulator MprA